MPTVPSSTVPVLFVLGVTGLIVGFVVGVGTSGFIMERWSPPQHGEGHMAIAYGAFFIGGPVGAVIGAVLGGIVGRWWWPRLGTKGRVSLAVGVIAVLSVIARMSGAV